MIASAAIRIPIYQAVCGNRAFEQHELENMVFITCYGGANEIGGNQILVEDKSTKVWLDFGMSFTTLGRYYSAFLGPRKCNGLGDYFELGLIPPHKGLYRTDYLRRVSNAPDELLQYDALLVSHCHVDHIGMLPLLRSDLPIYVSETSLSIMKSLDETSSVSLGGYTYLQLAFQFTQKLRGEGMKRLIGKEARVDRDIRTLESSFKIGDWQIHAYPVDHSIPGSTGFIINTPDLSIAYTGDIRFHGFERTRSENFMESARKAHPDVLICEGTNIGKSPGLSEDAVANEINRVVQPIKGLVVANYPSRDVDRLVSFHKAAQASGRQLLITLEQAVLLRNLKQSNSAYTGPTLGEVGVFIPRKGWGLIDTPNISREMAVQDYDSWARELLDASYAVTAETVKNNPHRYVLTCNFYDLSNLIDIHPPQGSLYIRSITEPFDDETQIEERKVREWLQHFNLYPYVQIHCSGHISGDELVHFIERINPRWIVPVHTEHVQLFKTKIGENIKTPVKGRTLNFE